MKELSRSIMTNSSEGMACGPIGMYAIDAEIVVEDDGRQVFLHGQWVDLADEDVFLTATTVSLMDIYKKLNILMGSDEHDEFDAAIRERDKLEKECALSVVMPEVDIYTRYAAQYDELCEMVRKQLVEDDVYSMIYNPDEDDEWEEEDDEEEYQN